jgi:hypothetical protein
MRYRTTIALGATLSLGIAVGAVATRGALNVGVASDQTPSPSRSCASRAAAPRATTAPGRGQRTAAGRFGWTRLAAEDDFTGTGLDRGGAWEIYDGPGHAGNGRRSPDAVTVGDGVLRITGTAHGRTGGIAWKDGSQRTGRWEARIRVSRACACYHPVLLLWPTAGGGGVAPAGGGGEIDYSEVIDDGQRAGASFFLHYGPADGERRKDAHVSVDLTRWHAFAVEWTNRSISGFVDGRRWFRTTDRRTLPPAALGQTIQLDWFPEDSGRTAAGIDRTAAAILEVDWIRMYEL